MTAEGFSLRFPVAARGGNALRLHPLAGMTAMGHIWIPACAGMTVYVRQHLVGLPVAARGDNVLWIPACAGMTATDFCPYASRAGGFAGNDGLK
jgi:hypothetical protein